jgi:hypothetical protein
VIAREQAEALAAKWGVYTASLDGEHLVLALEEAFKAGEAALRDEVKALAEECDHGSCGLNIRNAPLAYLEGWGDAEDAIAGRLRALIARLP